MLAGISVSFLKYSSCLLIVYYGLILPIFLQKNEINVVTRIMNGVQDD